VQAVVPEILSGAFELKSVFTGDDIMSRISTLTTLLLVLLYSVSLTEEALAYLDPGSGSMMLQLLLGGIVGVAAILKLYWNSFTGLFWRKKHQDNSTPPFEVDK
jgi:hypothetical protein